MSASLRIAVADDEPDMRDYFRRMLPRKGHQVVSIAENGRELVEHCRQFQPDLVISDILMPEMDGLAAAAAILEERPVPIILVSAHHDQMPMNGHGAIMAYLAKPFTLPQLEAAIDDATARYQALHGKDKADR